MNNLENVGVRDPREQQYTPSLQKLRAGDQTEWGRWYTSLTPHLLAFAETSISDHEVAQDLVQEAWEKVVGKLGTVKEPSLNTYVKNSLKQSVRAHVSKAGKEPTMLGIDEDKQAGRERIEETVVNRLWLRDNIRNLPHSYQEHIVFFAEGRTLRELADDTRTYPNAIKQKRHRAFDALRTEMLLSEAIDDQEKQSKKRQRGAKQRKRWADEDWSNPSSRARGMILSMIYQDETFEEIKRATGAPFEAIRTIVLSSRLLRQQKRH